MQLLLLLITFLAWFSDAYHSSLSGRINVQRFTPRNAKLRQYLQQNSDHIVVSSESNQPKALRPTSIKQALATLLFSVFACPMMSDARPEGVNRPDLLPKTFSTIIDTANFLTKGEEKRIANKISELESKTGYKLRIVCQAYPETPGLAVKDYWQVDDKTLVVVFDEGAGFNRKGIPSNVINLNLGTQVDEALPPMFWTRLVNKLGNQPMVKKLGGIDYVVENTVEAITYCLQSKDCKDVPFEI